MAKKIKSYDPAEAEDILSDVEAAEREVATWEEEVNTIKESLKDAKERYEEAVDQLRQCARRRNESNPLLDAARKDGDE